MRNSEVLSGVFVLALAHTGALAQTTPQPEAATRRPLYEVTIVSRTTKAINYGYLSAPTRIDFRGTPLLSDARGESIVEPKRGATVLKMHFDHVPPPSRFGAQFLAYVVWAISPDGRAQNLGELTVEGSGKARLQASTPLQTFAMIITAEPYYSVTQPSDVVVMENVVGPGTIGKVEEVNATYELLPRKPYTYDPASLPKQPTRMVKQEEYEATAALYQALNAIQIAQSQNADRYAPEQMLRARDVYNKARLLPLSLNKEIVTLAREATQIAEDSRAVANKRADAERAVEEPRRAVETRPTAPPPPAENVRARTEVQRAPEPPPPPPPAANADQEAAPSRPPIQVDERQFSPNNPQALSNRKRLLNKLSGSYETIDSSRGLVITVPEQLVGSTSLTSYLAPLIASIKPYNDLHLEVEGHTDVPNQAASERAAQNVKQVLLDSGVSSNIIVSRGFGNTRLRESNATATGRARNRRVEIVVAGDSIGTLPTWDRTYKLLPTPK